MWSFRWNVITCRFNLYSLQNNDTKQVFWRLTDICYTFLLDCLSLMFFSVLNIYNHPVSCLCTIGSYHTEIYWCLLSPQRLQLYQTRECYTEVHLGLFKLSTVIPASHSLHLQWLVISPHLLSLCNDILINSFFQLWSCQRCDIEPLANHPHQ